MITSRDVHYIANLLSSHVKKERDSSVNAHSESAYRSAISRYYYSAYLELRDILMHIKLEDDASRIKHAEMSKQLGRLRRLANKNRANVSHREHSAVVSSLNELAAIIDKSRALRENCDYDIGKPLFTTYAEAINNLKDAKGWYATVVAHKRIVERILPQLI
jgi:uncharacterized protein (UPF0332 family)